MKTRSSHRTWLFRVGAIALGLSPLFVLEVVLVALDVGQVDRTSDPFIGFDGQRPLFVPNAATGDYEIAAGRYLCFCPDGFGAEKANDEYRVFCLGGSTVQGRPYAIETSFTTWLELSLQAADSSRKYDVVNCGGISYASYRLVPILQEVLNHEPDLIILYTGHNEFLEDRTYRHIKQRSWFVNFMLRYATGMRSFNVLWSYRNHWQQSDDQRAVKPRLPEEVEARLDYQGGLALYQRDPSWQRGVVEHFNCNVRRMIALCQAADVPIWIADPVCSLSSCPPFKSENRDDIADAELARWHSLREQASRQYRLNLFKAVSLLEQASAIDDQHAGLAYDLAECYVSLGRIDEARAAYLRAKEMDVCPLRLIEPLRQVIYSASRDADIPMIEVNDLFHDKSKDGIPGGYLLVDHVHPSITGHQLIAELMMRQFIDQGTISPDSSWIARRERMYADHMATLTDKYYLEGSRRLDSLRKWAAGRAEVQRSR